MFYALCYVLFICLVSFFFFFSSRRRHTRSTRDWSSDVCSSDLVTVGGGAVHRFHADVAACTDAVLDDRLLLPHLREFLAHHPGGKIGGPAWSEGDDDPHRLRGPGILRQRRAGGEGKRAGERADGESFQA